jgi:hypothetical protein
MHALDVRVPDWARFVISDHTDMHRAPHPVTRARWRASRSTCPTTCASSTPSSTPTGACAPTPSAARPAEPLVPEVTEVRGPATAAPARRPARADRPAWTVRAHKLDSRAFGERRVVVASPPDATGPLPVVVLHDGVAYQRLARAADVLAALVRRAAPAPRTWCSSSPATASRSTPGTSATCASCTTRCARSSPRTTRPAAEWWAMGASLGGLAAATLALHAPGRLDGRGRAGGRVPRHARRPPPPRRRGLVGAERLEAAPARPALGAGRRHARLAGGVNRRVRDALDAHGADVAYASAGGPQLALLARRVARRLARRCALPSGGCTRWRRRNLTRPGDGPAVASPHEPPHREGHHGRGPRRR